MNNFDQTVENMLDLLSKEELNILPLVSNEDLEQVIENNNFLKLTDIC